MLSRDFARSWWRHQMETFSPLLAICAGNSPVHSRHKGQWRGALMFTLICVWINGWVNNREAGDLRRYRAHYDVIVMISPDILNMLSGQQWWYRITDNQKNLKGISNFMVNNVLVDCLVPWCAMTSTGTETAKDRDQFKCVSNQWETSLHCDHVSHWLSVYLDWSLKKGWEPAGLLLSGRFPLPESKQRVRYFTT